MDRGAAGADLGGSSAPCNEKKTDCGPEGAGSLAGSGEDDGPSDEIGRAEVDHAAGLKPEVLDAIDWAARMGAKGRVGRGQEDEPAEGEDGARDNVKAREQAERKEAEGGPGRAGGEGLEVALAGHGAGEIVDGAEAGEGG